MAGSVTAAAAEPLSPPAPRKDKAETSALSIFLSTRQIRQTHPAKPFKTLKRSAAVSVPRTAVGANLADLVPKPVQDRIRSGLMGLWDRAQLKLGVGELPREFAAEIEQAKTRDAGKFHALKTEPLTDRRQHQKLIKLMHEKHRRERNDLRSNLGYWLTLDRSSQREALNSHKAELDKKQTRTQQRQERLRNRDKGLEI